MEKGQRNVSLDLIQIIATFLVVMIHQAANVNLPDDANPVSLTILNAICEACVPLFLMKTGALLLKKERPCSLKSTFRRIGYISAVIVFWGLFYNVVSYTIIDGFSASVLLRSVKSVITADTAYNYQFWYLYMLLGLYAVIPIIKPFFDNAEKKDLLYLLGFCCLCGCLLPFLSPIIKINKTSFWLIRYFPWFSGFLFYCALGEYLSRYPLNKAVRVIGAVLVIPLGVITVLYPDIWLTYFSPFTILYSISVFCALQDIPSDRLGEKCRRFIQKASELSFGVYIMHPILILAARKILHIGSEILPPAVLGVIVFSLINYSVCTFITMIIKKIPILRKIV
ncbi:MAG: acyltransferase [Lachnospiraceae bacterium]|nr:acyltransferase [Lachnospiraceae bacterium]